MVIVFEPCTRKRESGEIRAVTNSKTRSNLIGHQPFSAHALPLRDFFYIYECLSAKICPLGCN